MITAMPLRLSENRACRNCQGKGAHVKSSAFQSCYMQWYLI